MELCGAKAGAGRWLGDCCGGGGWGVVVAGSRWCGNLTGSKFWSELKIENHDIEAILLVRSC